MSKKLWEASYKQKLKSNLYDYETFISKKFNVKFNSNYKAILNWSIKNSATFCMYRGGWGALYWTEHAVLPPDGHGW